MQHVLLLSDDDDKACLTFHTTKNNTMAGTIESKSFTKTVFFEREDVQKLRDFLTNCLDAPATVT